MFFKLHVILKALTIIVKAVRKVFDCTPKAMIENLNLRKPIYRSTAAYGHFGRSEFSWEQTDKIQDLISAINMLDALP